MSNRNKKEYPSKEPEDNYYPENDAYKDDDYEDDDYEDDDYEDDDYEDDDYEDDDYEDDDYEDDDYEDDLEAGMIKCLTCGTKNPLERRKCIKCNNSLLKPLVPQKYDWNVDDMGYKSDGYKDDLYERKLAPETVNCIACGTINQIEKRKCVRCNNILVKPFAFIEKSFREADLDFRESVTTISSLGSVSYVITPHLSVLMKNATGVMDGKVTSDEFKKAIKAQRNRVNRSLKKLPRIEELLLNKTREAEEIATLLRNGLNLYVDALNRLKRYFKSRSFEDINTGIEMAKEANQQVYKVKVMTDKAKRKQK